LKALIQLTSEETAQEKPGTRFHEIQKHDFIEKTATAPATLKALMEKGIIECFNKQVSRLNSFCGEITSLHQLNPPQKEAMGAIQKEWEKHDVCLLYGVTSSGKTEIYIHLIQECLQKGKQVLYLLPEIALTTQITDRLKQVFGDKLGIYHSKFSEAERVEIWNNLLHKEGYDIIVGVRSSVFLPFHRLGMVIVDEEHGSSYKQQDPAPRYHARNVAIVLAKLFGAKVLLGTAYPFDRILQQRPRREIRTGRTPYPLSGHTTP
jgi:Primosomal protein N'' (replication factor Y) - superfamily II helicase